MHWPVSSLLKAWAIKSISAPFSKHLTTIRITKWNTVGLFSWNHKLSRRLGRFFPPQLSETIACFPTRDRGREQTSLFNWSGHQGDDCVRHVWPVVIPCHSPNRSPAHTKSGSWLQAWMVPIVSCCSPSVLKAKTSLRPLEWRANERDEPGRLLLG